MFRLAAGLVVAIAVAALGGSAHASAPAFDPLPLPGGARSRAPVSLSPFRLAGDATAGGATTTTSPSTSTSTSTSPSTSKPAACRRDEDCPAENICENGACQAIQQRTNILYLYYREGSFQEILGLYWSKRGTSGYNVLVPFYWHFWSPEARSRVVAPFFWRFEDFAARRTLTVIVPGLPISWSSQPDAESFGVWPLFYRSTKFGWAAPLLGTFVSADPDNKSSLGAILFLYWWKRSPERSTDVLFPLLVSRRGQNTGFTWVVPLNFYWRDRDDRNLLALPFFYWNAHKNGGSLYALTGYHSHEGAESSGSLFWLYWFGRDEAKQSGYDVLFPLIWSFRSPASTTTVALPLIHVRRGGWRLTTVLPLLFAGADDAKGDEFRTLLPLFYWQRTEHGKKSLLLLPLGGYSRDDTDESRTLVLFPLIFARRDRDGALQAATPLFIRYWNKREGSTTTLFSLLLYLRDDPRGSSSVLFPLFWRFHDTESGASATAFFPFFAHRSGPRDDSTFAGVFPVMAYTRSFRDGGWSAGLFPIAFFGKHNGASHGVFFPIFWRFASPSSSTTVLAPLFYTRSDKHGSDSAILPLLTFFGHSDGEHYAVQFPLFWRFGSERERWTTTVTPIGYYHETRDGKGDGWSGGFGPLLPIVYAGSSPGKSHFVLLPLFWRFRDDAQQSTTTVALNYMHRTRGEETTDALFPLVYYRRGARPGGGDETSFTLFPLLHFRRDAESRFVITPLGIASRNRAREVGFVGPYFWYRKPTFSATLLFPLYLDVQDEATHERTRQLGPYIMLDGPGRQSRVLFPLYGRYDDALEHDTYVFPTFFHQRKTDGYELDTFIPLFWRSKWQGRTTTVIGPWYDRSGPGVKDTGLAPLYFYAKNDTRSITVVPPLLLYRRADFRENTVTMFALLTYHARDPSSHTTVVFPFWWSGHDQGQSHRVLFPIYWGLTDEDAKTDFNLLGPIYWSRHGTSRTRGLLPIAWYTRDPSDGSGANAFVPLFYESHGPKRSTFLTLLGGFRDRETSHLWYVGPVASSDSVETRFRMVFPLWFSHWNRATDARTRVIPPLLNVTHTTPESTLSTWLALYWHHRSITSETYLVLPLYYDLHDLHQTRTTVLFPLLWRHQDDSDQSTSWLAPLFYRHSTPTASTTVFFPLVWDIKDGDRRTTVVFPFYAHWRRPTYESTWVFPTYYYREGRGPKGEPDGTYRRLVAPFFETAVKRPGDYMWEVLGGLFGGERIGRNHYVKVFFMTFETQAPAHNQSSWYGKPLRASRRTPPRGVGMNVW